MQNDVKGAITDLAADIARGETDDLMMRICKICRKIREDEHCEICPG